MLKKNKEIVSILFSFLLRILLSRLIEPGIDEAYYGYLSRNFAWGFFDHPPAVAILAGMGERIFGFATPFTLRFGSILLFTISSWFLYDLTRILFNKQTAYTSLIFFNVIPFFFLGSGCFVFPDNALTFGWILFIWTLAKLRKTDNHRWLLLSGIAAGISLMSKYHAVFLFASLGWLMLFYRDWRKYWKSIWLYLGLLMAILIFLPNIFWNYQNNWVSYIYQFAKGNSSTNFSIQHALRFIAGQMGYLLPWHYIIMIISSIRVWKDTDNPNKWLLPFAVIPFSCFFYFGITRTVLPHWSMPSFIALLPLSSEYMQKWKVKTRNNYLKYSFLFLLIVISVYTAQTLTGFISINPKADPTLDGEGWDEVITELKNEGWNYIEAFLFTNKYYTGGELAYAANNDFKVTVLNPDAHNFAFTTNQNNLLGKNALMITQNDRYPRNPKNIYGNYFDNIKFLKDINTYRPNGKLAQTYRIYLCENYNKKIKYSY